MIRWWLVRAGAVVVAMTAPAVAQRIDDDSRAANRDQIPRPLVQGAPTSVSPVGAAPLVLRGRTVPTGLTGFYDYQSNGGSPGYLFMRSGAWDQIYTTFMSSALGANADDVTNSRRVGYSYSSNGGASWVTAESISDTRLGFPYLVATSEGSPLIAAHGDVGEGDQSLIYTSPSASDVGNFFLAAQLPIAAASGKEAGVVWPQMALTSDESRAVLIGSYNNDVDGKEPQAPLQVTSVDINSGAVATRWNVLTDSLNSITSGGRAVIARADNGNLGAAWYRFAVDTNDTEGGIYFAESTDGGTTWGSATRVLVGDILVSDFNIGGDPDTLSAGGNLDFAYRGNEPQIVMTGTMNGFLQFANVLYWSPSTNLRMIALSHQEPGLGAFGIPFDHRQGNMGSIAYPTISVADDNRHVVVAFSAVAQTIDDAGETTSVWSDQQFMYYRVWAVGSPDGGENWGKPFIVQDFAGDGTDSASIEYPVANEHARMVDGNFELPLVFQARRYPGMFAFTGDGELAGPITETSQYFQRFIVTPQMFTNISSTRHNPTSGSTAKFGVRVVPNVTGSSATVELSLPAAGTIDVRIHTLLGEEVYATKKYGRMGVERVAIDLQDLPPGTYRCTVTQNGYATSTPVVVVR